MIKKMQTHGIANGNTIQIKDDLGLADGEQVDVTVAQVERPVAEPVWGEGLRRCAGALADSWTEEDDRILEQIHREFGGERR